MYQREIVKSHLQESSNIMRQLRVSENERFPSPTLVISAT